MAEITLEELNKILEYDPETGKFTWIKYGKIAGNRSDKYERINIGNKKYNTHYLVWLLHYGVWPNKIIEHTNKDTYDNRINNLREHSSYKSIAQDDLLEEIRKQLNYNSETGEFTWKVTGKGRKESVGVLDSAGYQIVTVCGKSYKGHRLAWLISYKTLPKFIDHINGNKSDNRLCNLRETTIRENGQNRKEHRNGRMVGVTQSKTNGKWKAQVNVNGKKTSLGTYKTELEAHKVYINYLICNNLPCRSSIICS